ncbi:MAG TPA: calcium/sodium antiporter [Prolixibacteraceae bacterium]|nr:calcium/sodium antiporter [Prolixibacteraceae bacterium]
MITNIFIIICGFVLLIIGADWFVKGASALAKRFHVSELAIGLTVVAFGTSAPELVVNTFAAWDGYSDIVFGNIIGSNNFNLYFILGLSGVIVALGVQSSTAWREIPFSLGAALVLFLLVNDSLWGTGLEPRLSRPDALILLAFFGAFLYYVYRQMRSDAVVLPEPETQQYPGWKTSLLIVLGLAGLIIGGKLVVNHATDLARALHVSEKIIGLTIVAAGTSLPELATSLVAAIRKNNDIAVGNIIGSNIFNIFLILGVSALIRPVAFNIQFNTDLYILLGGTAFLWLAMFTGRRKKLDRWEAGLLLAFFVGYTVFLLTKG